MPGPMLGMRAEQKYTQAHLMALVSVRMLWDKL